MEEMKAIPASPIMPLPRAILIMNSSA
jgi:hypothetical protein